MESHGFEYLLRDVARMCRDRFERHGGTLGLTQTELNTLCTISAQEGIKQARLATLSEIEPTKLARLIDRMVSDGWIERRPVESERLFLSEKIKPVVAAVLQNAARTRNEALAGLNEGASNGIKNILRNISRSLSSDTEPLDGFDHGRHKQCRALLESIRANLRAVEAAAESREPD
jgi:MarR family transcriptional regulator, transcriptional regulator for hemolysin